MQHAGRWTGTGRKIVQAVGRQIDNQARQLMHHAGSWLADWTEKAGQEMEQTAGRQIEAEAVRQTVKAGR